MNPTVYNLSIGAGTLLVSVGAGMIHVPSGLIVGGVLIIALTIAAARLTGRAG